MYIFPSLKPVCFIVSELFVETCQTILQSFVWRRHVGVPPKNANNQQEHLELNLWWKVFLFSFLWSLSRPLMLLMGDALPIISSGCKNVRIRGKQVFSECINYENISPSERISKNASPRRWELLSPSKIRAAWRTQHEIDVTLMNNKTFISKTMELPGSQ